MIPTHLSLALLASLAPMNDENKRDDVPVASFAKPIQMQAGGSPVKTEEPGYASPAWYDVNGDGHMDLVVGQFSDGKLRVYHGQKDGSLAEGEWLKADGEVAEVPGVW